MACFFFPSCKRYSGTKRLNASENLILSTIQFCCRLDLSLRLKGVDVIKHVT